MNSYEIIVTPDAEADLYEIKNYIAETLLVPDVALNYIRVIRKEMENFLHGRQHCAGGT
ncbi:MAG: type II toxin-antitoxin system RelE/ParE family toxin [Lachnospiraceae bacterium]|nr:type II toxin-antitoxin system RelE/ParE family toxin [Lachnospiraceae bacterium]MCI1657440.1 type II toxin-antitoxin system RelE/ParE family toxin [Lachnospiraceae bacterium]MCI2195855.1 type II toxin-antitoxin system RelE/ParE family toxin [Lachnospiraceae bacterium]